MSDDYEGATPSPSATNSDYEGAIPTGAAPKKTSFLGDMATNVKNAAGDVKDLATGNYEHVFSGGYNPTPKTEDLADKLFTDVSSKSPYETAGDVLLNIRDKTKPSDYSSALLEKMGGSAPGKALGVIQGVSPVMNAVSTLVNRDINPAISKATGIEEPNLQLGELVAGTRLPEKVKSIKEPSIPAAKYIGAKIAESSPVKAIGEGTKTLKEGYNARNVEALDKVMEKLNGNGDTAFKAMRKSGVKIIPEKSQQIAAGIEKTLADSTGKNDPALHGGTLRVLRDMQKASKKGLDIEDMHIYQKRLGHVINKNSIAGGNREDAMKATVAKDLIDDHLNALTQSDIPPEALNAINLLHVGKAVWAQMRAFETIADIIKKSNGDPNRMKTLFEALKNNKKKMNQFNVDDKALINDAALNSTGEGLAKMLGKFGITLGSGRSAATGNIMPALEFLIAGAKKGTSLVGAGTGAKYLQGLSAKAKAERVLKNIEKRDTGYVPEEESPIINTMQPLNKAISPPGMPLIP